MFVKNSKLFEFMIYCSKHKQLTICRGKKIINFKAANRTGRMKTFTYENQYLRLSDTVEPLWRKSYTNQLSLKKYIMEKCIGKAYNILRDIRRLTDDEYPFLRTMREEYGGKICTVKDTIPSPLTRGYRNKETLNLGPDIKGDKRTLGLYVGNSYHNTLTCVQTYFLSIKKERHKEITKVVQDFINKSSYEPKFLADREGNWKTVTMKSNMKNEVMLIFGFHPQRESQEFVDGAKEEIKQYFVHGPGKQLGISSIYFQSSWYHLANHEQFPFELLHGVPTITENLLDLEFQISPNSFFQGNPLGAELLYSTALDLANVTSETTVLDICCGTGTIGIIAAKRAKRVLGVEIRPQAVEDANRNAQMNGITNTDFRCNLAHRMLREVVNNDELKEGEDVVAFVNPGRSGVNKKLIESIRNCPRIKKVVYISCKPIGNVLSNFINLICPPDDVLVGDPFIPVVAVPVDMFPQTLHCELVVLFER